MALTKNCTKKRVREELSEKNVIIQSLFQGINNNSDHFIHLYFIHCSIIDPIVVIIDLVNDIQFSSSILWIFTLFSLSQLMKLYRSLQNSVNTQQTVILSVT